MNAHTPLCPECLVGEPSKPRLFDLAARSAVTPDVWFTKQWRAFQAWRRRRQAIDALRTLDDRTLKDIGIDRSEIRSVVIEHQAIGNPSPAVPDRPAEWAVNLPRPQRS